MDVEQPISTPPDSAGRKFYLSYLNSGSWRVTRNRALQRAGYKCERCTSKRDLQVHHRCYDRLGREWDQDLEVLCDTCHGGHHEAEQARRGISIKLYIKLVSLKLHDRSITTFADLSEAVKRECAKLKIPYDSDRIGQAIALSTGKLKPQAPVVKLEQLVTSHEPINKADAMRVMSMLSDELKDQVIIRAMPSPQKTVTQQQAHEARIKEQVAAEYRRRRDHRPSMQERLEAIFSERPA